MDPAKLAGEAAARFNEGDYTGFARCFADPVTIYDEPEVAQKPAVRTRAEVEAFAKRMQAGNAPVKVQIPQVDGCGRGAVAETIILTADVWRLALAVACSDDEIVEVRAFRDREAATAFLVHELPG